MSKAKKISEEYVVHLELSREEAETLHAVCARIGGSPRDTRRVFMDNIERSLNKLGVNQDTSDISHKDRAIYFVPRKETK